MKYLILPNLIVSNANALATTYLISPVSILPACFLSHIINIELGISVKGTGLVLHHTEIKGEIVRGAYGLQLQQFRGATPLIPVDKFEQQKLQPTASYNAEVSIVLELEDSEPIPNLQDIQSFITSKRFAGGAILSARNTFVCELQELKGKLPSGRWVLERTHLLNGSQKIQTLISQYKKSEEWLMPAHLGYKLLSEPTDKVGARDGYKHAYAEPLISLTALGNLRSLQPEELEFWNLQWLDSTTYIAKTTKQKNTL